MEVENRRAGQDVFDQLEALYHQPWRRYHDFNHIEWCLHYFDKCREQAADPDSLELAIWFHDCIYVIGACDNEANSRDWFLSCSEGFLKDPVRERVANLIMDTYFRDNPFSEDGKLMVDIDLSNLGGSWDMYVADSKAVMDELVQVESATLESVTEQVLVFLQHLLDKEYVYHTNYYRTNFEGHAQSNIMRYANQLKSHQ